MCDIWKKSLAATVEQLLVHVVENYAGFSSPDSKWWLQFLEDLGNFLNKSTELWIERDHLTQTRNSETLITGLSFQCNILASLCQPSCCVYEIGM